MSVTLYGGPYDGDTLGVPLGHTLVRMRHTGRDGEVRVYVYELGEQGAGGASAVPRFVYAREEALPAESR